MKKLFSLLILFVAFNLQSQKKIDGTVEYEIIFNRTLTACINLTLDSKLFKKE